MAILWVVICFMLLITVRYNADCDDFLYNKRDLFIIYCVSLFPSNQIPQKY